MAVLGVDAASGDTYASQYPYCTLHSMFVPEPVIKMAIAPANRDGADRLGKALQRFRREDPTLHVSVDEETGETIIAGMGELHLEIYLERIRREFKVEVEAGAPKVNYREAPTQSATFNIRHKKQTGGAGQFAHIVGRLDVLPEDSAESFVFEDEVSGGRIPKQYIPAVEKGFRQCIHKGPVAGYPVVGLMVTLEDGSYHDVDSSDMAFQTCARTAMRETFSKTKPVLLEPIMKIEIECPSQFQGTVVGNLTGRRGMVVATELDGVTADRGRGPLGRDVRLFDRPAEHDARAGDVHHGVRPLSPRAVEHRARGHRRSGRAPPRPGPSEGGRRKAEESEPRPADAGGSCSSSSPRPSGEGQGVRALAKRTSKGAALTLALPRRGRGP